MRYALIKNKVVTQTQPNKATGFVEISDDVVCGQIKQTDGSFKNPDPIPPSPPTIAELLAETEDLGTIAEKLEEIIDFLENSTPLSQKTKDWMSNRKIIRQ